MNVLFVKDTYLSQVCPRKLCDNHQQQNLSDFFLGRKNQVRSNTARLRKQKLIAVIFGRDEHQFIFFEVYTLMDLTWQTQHGSTSGEVIATT